MNHKTKLMIQSVLRCNSAELFFRVSLHPDGWID